MTIRNYTQKRKKQLFLVGGITLLSCFSALFFMTVFSDIPISHLPQLLIRFFQNENLSPQEKIILYMRMPTVLMTILAGISLSISGGVMQSITHNDLVSPFTLGISAAAAFGASLCIVFGGSVLHSTGGLILGAFTASCLCISLVYGLSFKTGSAASTLVLIGIAMNYLFSAGSAAIQFLAKEYKLGEIIQWTFGTFNKADWYSVASTSIICLISIIIYYILSLPLDAMAANDDETVISLGINPAGIRLSAGLVSVLLTIHDLNLAAMFCDRLLILKDGHIWKDGTPSAILTEENIKTIYGIDTCIIEKNGQHFIQLVAPDETTS